jgi:hypothetical protein
MSQDTSYSKNEQMRQQEGSGLWPKLSGQVLDKVIGRDMSLTCNFDNIKIDLQKQLA